MRKIAFIFLAMLIPAMAFAWGAKGHDIVACVAEKNISKKTRRAVEKVLDGHSMVYVANWMDNASHTKEYAYTKTWHYVNVDPKEQTYFNSEKEAKGDVVTAINSIVANLKSGDLNPEEERAQLMMLIHLVGDMHCPMHAGRRTDRGGNGFKLKWFGQNTSLHSLWDSKIIESARTWSYTEWRDHLDTVSKKYKKEVMKGTYEEWFTATVSNAALLYEYQEALGDGRMNPYEYVYKFSPMLEEQLLLGGLRLAYVLNSIF